MFQADSIVFNTFKTDSSNSDTQSFYKLPYDSAIMSDSGVSDTAYQNKKLSESRSGQETFFTGKQRSDQELLPVVRSVENTDWITIHLIVSLCLIAYVQIYYSKRFKQIMNAFLGNRYVHMLIKESNIYRERFSIPLVIVYLISFSLLVYLLISPFLNPSVFDLSGLKLFSVIILIVITAWFIKNLSINFIGNLFKNYIILTDYIQTNFIFNMIIGVLLLPVVVVAVFFPSIELVIAGVLAWFAIYIYRIIRQVFTGLSYRKFSLFYRILYLCTFELIPLLVLTKLVVNLLT